MQTYKFSVVTPLLVVISLLLIGITSYQTIDIQRQQKLTHEYTFSLEQKSELAQKMNRSLIHLIISVIIASTLITAIVASRRYKIVAASWILAIFFSVILTSSIVLIWYLEISSANVKKQENIVETQEQVDQFFNFYTKKYPLSNVHYLPVGFVIYSMEVDQNLVTYFSYPWIKYQPIKDAGIEGEFYVSNANKEEHTTVNTIQQKDYKVLGWQSSVKINERFDYSKFPFDLQQIVFKFNHAQWSGNNILVPDFSAYKQATLEDPQLDPDLTINKWNIVNAYFFYSLSNWQSNFGIEDFEHQKNFPYLSYTIEIQRNFFNPLVLTLLPILIILFLVFAALIIFPSMDAKSHIHTIISLLSGMFFATIVAQQTFERTIDTSDITYFACFYYIVYIVIFLVAINCMLYTFQKNNYLIQLRNNSLAQITYWPSIMLTFFIITLYFFY